MSFDDGFILGLSLGGGGGGEPTPYLSDMGTLKAVIDDGTANLSIVLTDNGNNDSVEKELYADTIAMYNKLTKDGYNSEKITLVLEEEAKHNEGYWRLIFPEMLCWCYQP